MGYSFRSMRTSYYDEHEVDIEFAGHAHGHFRTYPLLSNPFDSQQYGIITSSEKENYNAHTIGTVYQLIRPMTWTEKSGAPCLYVASPGETYEYGKFPGWTEVTVEGKRVIVESYTYTAGDDDTYTYIDPRTRALEDRYVIDKNDAQEPPGPIISNINIRELGAYRAVVEFQTDVPSKGQIEFGLESNDPYLPDTYPYVDTRADFNQVFDTAHNIPLQCLTPGTTYYFRVKALSGGKEAISDEYSFTTESNPQSGELIAEYDFGPPMFQPEAVRTSVQRFDSRLRNGWLQNASMYNKYFYPPYYAYDKATETYCFAGNEGGSTWRTELPNGTYDVEVMAARGSSYWWGDQRIAIEDDQVIFEAREPEDTNSTIWKFPANITVTDGFLDVKVGYADGRPKASIINRVRIWTTGHFSSYDYDVVPPARIDDLRISSFSDDFVTLTWTVPGDDGMTGQATGYDLRRHGRTDITNEWRAAEQIPDEPLPTAPGTSQSYTFSTGLPRNTMLAIKTFDEVPNFSAISNLLQMPQTPGTGIYYIIKASADTGGTIDPSGDAVVLEGENQPFTITPNDGYHIEYVLVDGVSVGIPPGDPSTHTFESVDTGHTIYAEFAPDELDLAKGLIGHWKFDEGSGTTAYDSSGNDYNATLMGDPTWTDGMISGALLFDGNDDYLDCGNPVGLEPTQTITVSAWVKTQSASKYDTIISKPGPRRGASYVFRILDRNAPYFSVAVTNGWAYQAPSNEKSINDGVWHNLTGTYDMETIRFYFDGVEIGNGKAMSLEIDYTDSINLVIGASSTTHLNWNWPGKLDDIRIYNRALDEDEVALLAAVDIPGDVDGDGDVDIFDLFAVASAFGTVAGDAGFNPDCDFDDDGDVDITDLYTCGSNFGVGV